MGQYQKPTKQTKTMHVCLYFHINKVFCFFSFFFKNLLCILVFYQVFV